MPLTPDQLKAAWFEIERFQEIIARHEDHTFKIRGWCFAVVAALTTGLYTDVVGLTPEVYCGFGIVSVVLFFGWEIVQRAPKRVAINRVNAVEKSIRDDKDYDGPRIAQTFCDGGFKPLNEASMIVVWLPYLVAILVIVVVTIAHL